SSGITATLPCSARWRRFRWDSSLISKSAAICEVAQDACATPRLIGARAPARIGAVFERAQFLGEKYLLRLDRHQLERPAKIVRRSAVMAEARFEFAKGGVKQVIGIQLLALANCFDGFDASLRSMNCGDGDGAIERHDGRVIKGCQTIVE